MNLTNSSKPPSDLTRGDYMNMKIMKLHTSSVSNPSYGTPISTIFSACSIFVNGFTIPPRNEIQRLVIRHGGVFHSYQTSHTTHFLCNIFPNAKLKELRKSSSKKLFYVTVNWLIDSINQRKKLPEGDYLPQGLHGQHGDSMVKYFSSNFTKVDQAAEISVADEEEVEEEVVDDEVTEEFGEDEENEDEEKESTTIIDLENELSPPQLQTTSSLPTRLPTEKENDPMTITTTSNLRLAVSLPTKLPSSTTPTSTTPTSTIIRPSPLDNRGATSDPHFINNYFETSRLHFLGSWKARLPALQSLIEKEREKQGEPTYLSLPFPIDRPLHVNETKCTRTVIHIDMDCFFVSVLLRDRGDEFNKIPVAVAHCKSSGSSDVSSCNYPARAKGVRNGMFMSKAKELCPELVVFQYDFKQYEQVSEQIYRIFFTTADYLHLHPERVHIQPVSVDEAYLEIISTNDRQIEGLAVAALVRQRIRDETNCPSSAGIGENMLLARLATKHAKPNGQYQIFSKDCQEFMRDIPLSDLPGVGWKLGKKLKEKGFLICSDLWATPQSVLTAWFGPTIGAQLFHSCRGQDSRELSSLTERKSIGAEVNWGLRFTSSTEVETFLSQLCLEVCHRMERAQVAGKTLTLKVKKKKPHASYQTVKYLGHGDCDNVSKSISSQFLLTTPSLIAGKVIALFNSLPIPIPPEDVRGIGIHVTKLTQHDFTKPDSKSHLFSSTLQLLQNRNKTEAARRISKMDVLDVIHEEADTSLEASSEYVPPSYSQIDLDVLTQLPDDVKKEIKMNLPKVERKRKRTLLDCFKIDQTISNPRQLSVIRPREFTTPARNSSLQIRIGEGREEREGQRTRVQEGTGEEGEERGVHRSPLSLTQQADFLVNMPVELVEEVWEEMCSKYRSKYCHSVIPPNLFPPRLLKRKTAPLYAPVPVPVVVVQDDDNKEKEEQEEEPLGLLHRSHYTPLELENILTTWSCQDENPLQMNSLLDHTLWLFDKNQFDKISSLLKTIRRVQRYSSSSVTQKDRPNCWALVEEKLLQFLQKISLEKIGCPVSWFE